MSKVICIVDDQPSLRQMLRFSLKVDGLQVLEAENGVDALDKLANHDVDMMIVGWQMPKMDGMDLVRRLRKDECYADMPIVIISCRDDLDARKEARSLGVIAWLKKPFRIVEIQSVVESSMGIISRPRTRQIDQPATGYC
jgi:DNA-binding response OmpR family regulator